jgi:exonuclease III
LAIVSTLQSNDRLVGWIKNKTQPFVVYQKCTLLAKTNISLEGKDRNFFQANGAWKQAGVAIVRSNKADFKPKLVQRDKKSSLHCVKGIVHQEAITIINIYIPNVDAPISLNKFYWT